MKKLPSVFLVMCAIVALTMPLASAQNLLVNSSFEDPITTDGPPFVGFWEAFNGGGASSIRDTVDPLSGAAHMALSINNENNTFAGMFQDVIVAEGQPVTFSVWHKTTSLPFDLVSELRIEWRNSVSDTEISRTDNLITSPTDVYSLLSLSAPVPAGVDRARVVYAIQSFTNIGPDLGTVFVDDASVTIPEPATMALIGMSLVGLAGLRRRG